MALIRLETQAPPPLWPDPPFSTPLRGLLHPATLTVVLVTERLAAEHAALPCLSPKGLMPAEGMDTDILHAEGV